MNAAPDETACWQALRALRASGRSRRIATLVDGEPRRFAAFSVALDDLLLDYSRTALTSEIRAALLRLAAARGVAQRRDAMAAGARVNRSEDRAALHMALRAAPGDVFATGGADVLPEVLETRARVAAFADEIRFGAFTDVVNIGIGGSDLGPAMATLALAPYHDGPRVHFVSNVDGAHLHDVLSRLDPAATLVVVASKTFTTVETMTNAASARRWIVDALGEDAVARHFAAVSTATARVAAFGIGPERSFGFRDWVGGRYSIWSAIGLPLSIAIGPAGFAAFLAGAREMDRHFLTAAPDANMPLLLGMIGIWHRVLCGYPTRAVLPYDQRLARLPAYLQQLDMESNGKSVTAEGAAVALPTAPVVWGEPGTNGQHAFFQMLHQGTDIVPCEFLIASEGHEPAYAHHHALLVANCLAQAEALMRGRDDPALPPHRRFPGDRPSVTLAYRRLDPATLGKLIALYEHRVFVEAAILGINPFDQWGVELGKEMATALLPLVTGANPGPARDASTAGLLAHFATLRRPAYR
jgi:glucose-6-phosphate isomerase